MTWKRSSDSSADGSRSIEVSVLRGEHDASRIVQELLGSQRPDRPPVGYALVSEVRPETVDMLTSVASLLRDRRRDARPVLVAISANRRALSAVSDAYEVTVALSPHREEYLPGVMEFLPTLCTEHQVHGLGSLFSVRAVSANIDGLHPRTRSHTERVAHQLRSDRGVPLHPLAKEREPEAFVFAAPEEWQDTAQQALGRVASVIASQGSQSAFVTAAGLVSESGSSRRDPDNDVPPDGDEEDSGPDTDRIVGSSAAFPDEDTRREVLDGTEVDSADDADP